MDDAALEAVRRHLSDVGIEFSLDQVRPKLTAGELARRAVRRGDGIVLTAGGDGTASEVASALVGTETALGVLPLGTCNNIARSVGMPEDLGEACRVLAENRIRVIDVGRADGGRLFFEGAGVGLDAELFPLGEEVNDGKWPHFVEALRQGARYKPQRMTIELRSKDGQVRTIERKAYMVVVSNGPYYGFKMPVAPQARLDDGEFTVTIFRAASKLRLARHFWLLSRGKYRRVAEMETYEAAGVTIRSSSEQEVHCDGDPVSTTPATFEAMEKRLRILGGKRMQEAPTEVRTERWDNPEEARLSEATRRVLADGFASIRSEEDAERVLREIEAAGEEKEEVFEDQTPDRTPAEIADRLELDAERSEKDPAEAFRGAAEEIATAPALEREPMDEGVGEVGRGETDSPEEQQGRTLLRRVLIKRLKPLQAVDALGFVAVNSLPHPWIIDRLMSRLTWIMTGGHGWLIFLIPALLTQRRRGWQTALAILPPLWLITSIVEFPVKHFFRRKRPFVSIVRAVVVGRKPGSYSFPSGHSAAAAAGACLLCRYFPQYRPYFLTVAGLTLLSRIYLGAHYPGDVVSGSITGAVGARVFNQLLIALSKGDLAPRTRSR